MPKPKQDWIWYELMTSDVDAAIAFYRDVVGWQTEEVGGPHMRYVACGMGGGTRGVAGVALLTPQMTASGREPGWTGYLYADDVDRAAISAERAGAKLLREPMDVPGAGRFAILADPQGAPFHLFRPTPPAGEHPAALDQTAPGNVGWEELTTTDWEAAWQFYSGQFGWTPGESFDMGPGGRYQCFSSSEAPMTGGMMTVPAALRGYIPCPVWHFYFNVDDIRTAKERVERGGGKVLHGPAQVPGGGWIIHGADPQGARFSLLSRVG